MHDPRRKKLINDIDLLDLPDVTYTANNNPSARQALTLDNLAMVMRKLKLTTRFNVMTHRVELSCDGVLLTANEEERALTEIDDALTHVRIAPTLRVWEMVGVMARADRYHPMQDWIVGRAWDGNDRLEALAASVPTDDELWPIYLRRWLVQCIEAVRGWEDAVERSLPHVLVFVGGQGAGKGRWLRQLAPGYVLPDAELHLNSGMMKDSLLHTLKYPIVELGEIEATFKKADNDSLKNFLSRPDDSIRAPYERRAVDRPRMSVFAGSVNTTDFLRDPTGSRRFWPVQLREGEPLAWDHGIDVQQVFAQANELWIAGEDWNLNVEENEARMVAAVDFTQTTPGVDLVSAHWEKWRGDYDHYAVMNKTTIARLVGASMHPAELSGITHWLTQNLGPARRLKMLHRSWVFPVGADFVANEISFLPASETKKYVLSQPAAKFWQENA